MSEMPAVPFFDTMLTRRNVLYANVHLAVVGVLTGVVFVLLVSDEHSSALPVLVVAAALCCSYLLIALWQRIRFARRVQRESGYPSGVELSQFLFVPNLADHRMRWLQEVKQDARATRFVQSVPDDIGDMRGMLLRGHVQRILAALDAFGDDELLALKLGEDRFATLFQDVVRAVGRQLLEQAAVARFARRADRRVINTLEEYVREFGGFLEGYTGRVQCVYRSPSVPLLRRAIAYVLYADLKAA